MASTGDSLALLQQRADEAKARATALTDTYNRRTWFRFTAVFFPIPFVLVLMRFDLDYWHYYLAGGSYLLFAALLYAYDTRFSDKVKAAEKEADEARRQVEAAAEVH